MYQASHVESSARDLRESTKRDISTLSFEFLIFLRSTEQPLLCDLEVIPRPIQPSIRFQIDIPQTTGSELLILLSHPNFTP